MLICVRALTSTMFHRPSRGHQPVWLETGSKWPMSAVSLTTCRVCLGVSVTGVHEVTGEEAIRQQKPYPFSHSWLKGYKTAYARYSGVQFQFKQDCRLKAGCASTLNSTSWVASGTSPTVVHSIIFLSEWPAACNELWMAYSSLAVATCHRSLALCVSQVLESAEHTRLQDQTDTTVIPSMIDLFVHSV